MLNYGYLTEEEWDSCLVPALKGSSSMGKPMNTDTLHVESGIQSFMQGRTTGRFTTDDVYCHLVTNVPYVNDVVSAASIAAALTGKMEVVTYAERELHRKSIVRLNAWKDSSGAKGLVNFEREWVFVNDLQSLTTLGWGIALHGQKQRRQFYEVKYLMERAALVSISAPTTSIRVIHIQAGAGVLNFAALHGQPGDDDLVKRVLRKWT